MLQIWAKERNTNIWSHLARDPESRESLSLQAFASSTCILGVFLLIFMYIESKPQRQFGTRVCNT